LRAYVVVTLYGNQIAPAATAVLPSALQATKVASARWAICAGLVIATLEHMARAITDNVELRLNMQYSRWKLGGAIAGYVPRRCIGVSALYWCLYWVSWSVSAAYVRSVNW
jgi:hypothetical protein